MISKLTMQVFVDFTNGVYCRVTQSRYIPYVGIHPGSSWHLSARTLSGFGLSELEVKGNVFTSLAVTEISFTRAFSIQRTHRCWSLDVTRQVYIRLYLFTRPNILHEFKWNLINP